VEPSGPGGMEDGRVGAPTMVGPIRAGNAPAWRTPLGRLGPRPVATPALTGIAGMRFAAVRLSSRGHGDHFS
jgi:hypothetical protein